MRSMGTRQLLRRFRARAFYAACLAAVVGSVGTLLVMVGWIVVQGTGALNWSFLTEFPSRFPQNAGIKAALFGTLWLVGLTACFSVPVGMGAAIYLEEYATDNWFTRFIKTNIANLAGVPSIVYGIFGLAVFVRGMALGRSVLAGALTMALLVLPVVIVSAQEAIRAVPKSLRESSYALGATRWQTTRRVVFPAASASSTTGVILALSRAIGEAAPLIMIGALTFVAFVPDSPMSPFTVLPIQIFNWISRPQAAFHQRAAAAIMVLLAVVFVMNGLATFVRSRSRYEP